LVVTVALVAVAGGCATAGTPAVFHQWRDVLAQFAPPDEDAMPAGIIAGPNGHMWYVLRSGTTSAIGEIDDRGVTAVHDVPDRVAQIRSAVVGPDDAIWFTMTVGGTLPRTMDTTPSLEGGAGVVARMAADGHVDEFPLPDRGAVPLHIASGPGGLWVSADAGSGSSLMWRLSTNGVYTGVSSPGQVSQLVGGPDDSTWYAIAVIGPDYRLLSGIGRIDAAGSNHPVALSEALQGPPNSVAVGPDNAVWFVIGRRIIRVGPDGTVTTVGSTQCSGAATRSGQDLWCATGDEIYQISLAGTVIAHSTILPRGNTLGSSLTLGMIFGAATAPDGSVWFTDLDNERILHYE
jgi:streptogramin lyase